MSVIEGMFHSLLGMDQLGQQEGSPVIREIDGRKWRILYGGMKLAEEEGYFYYMAVPLDEWQAGHSPTAGAEGIMLPRVIRIKA